MEVEIFQDDYELSSPKYPPTASSSMIFESDVPASWTHRSAETSIIKFDRIIEYLTRLPHLEKLTMRTVVGLSMAHIVGLITRGSKFTELELSNSGYKSTHKLEILLSGLVTTGNEYTWSLKATRSELMESLSSVVSDGLEDSSLGNIRAG